MIRPLPPAPSRDNPGPFASQADALLAALAGFVDDCNALEQSLIFVGTTGQSSTALAVGAGTKTLTASTGKAWVVGAWVHLVSAGGIGNVMVGQVLDYDVDTGALELNVGAFAGSGTHSDWLIGLSTPQTDTHLIARDGSRAMTAELLLAGDAVNALGAVPKRQMDAAVAGVSGKRIAQVQSYQTGAVATGSGTFDVNAIPQQSGGDQYLSVSITPTNAESTLLVLVNCFASNSAANNNVAALFKDAAVDALAATSQYQGQATGFYQLSLQHVMLAGSTDATTFKVRCGGSGAGTTTFNGSGGVGYLGGVACSRITVLEVLP